jgi:hypothetical protein
MVRSERQSDKGVRALAAFGTAMICTAMICTSPSPGPWSLREEADSPTPSPCWLDALDGMHMTLAHGHDSDFGVRMGSGQKSGKVQKVVPHTKNGDCVVDW